MPSRPPCGKDGCVIERGDGIRQCRWHWLLGQSPASQAEWSARRLRDARRAEGFVERARVPKAEWPDGFRWCSGCQTFVPEFYTQGSRCRSCNSTASHHAHIEKTYGIKPEEYDAMLELQDGRCYICHRQPRTKRLAVDHDHKTDRVRGLLCADNERGCNHAVLGGLATAVDSPLEAARRVVEYLENPPYDRIQRGEAKPEKVTCKHRDILNRSGYCSRPVVEGYEYLERCIHHPPEGFAIQSVPPVGHQDMDIPAAESVVVPVSYSEAEIPDWML